MKENTPTTFNRLRITVEVEITEADAAIILSDKVSNPDPADTDRSNVEWRYVQDAISEIQAGQYTSTVLMPNMRSAYNSATGKWERVPA